MKYPTDVELTVRRTRQRIRVLYRRESRDGLEPAAYRLERPDLSHTPGTWYWEHELETATIS